MVEEKSRHIGLERISVVIEIGNYFTKCGYTGENIPRAVIQTPKFDLEDDKKLLNGLNRFLQEIYFKHLQSNPKERALFLIIQYLTPYKILSNLCQIAFNFYNIPKISFLFDAGTALQCTGAGSGIVLDVGYREARISHIFQGYFIANCMGYGSYGAQAIDNQIKESLKEINEGMDFTEQTIEEIKIRACFIPCGEQIEQYIKTQEESMKIQISSSQLINLSQKCRISAQSVIFQGEDNLVTLFLSCLLNCPVDTRIALISNVLLCGWTIQMPGFAKRFIEQLERELEENAQFEQLKHLKQYIQVPRTIFPTHLLSWIGGSLIGAQASNTPEVEQVTIAMESFNEENFRGLLEKLRLI